MVSIRRRCFDFIRVVVKLKKKKRVYTNQSISLQN